MRPVVAAASTPTTGFRLISQRKNRDKSRTDGQYARFLHSMFL